MVLTILCGRLWNGCNQALGCCTSARPFENCDGSIVRGIHSFLGSCSRHFSHFGIAPDLERAWSDVGVEAMG